MPFNIVPKAFELEFTKENDSFPPPNLVTPSVNATHLPGAKKSWGIKSEGNVQDTLIQAFHAPRSDELRNWKERGPIPAANSQNLQKKESSEADRNFPINPSMKTTDLQFNSEPILNNFESTTSISKHGPNTSHFSFKFRKPEKESISVPLPRNPPDSYGPSMLSEYRNFSSETPPFHSSLDGQHTIGVSYTSHHSDQDKPTVFPGIVPQEPLPALQDPPLARPTSVEIETIQDSLSVESQQVQGSDKKPLSESQAGLPQYTLSSPFIESICCELDSLEQMAETMEQGISNHAGMINNEFLFGLRKYITCNSQLNYLYLHALGNVASIEKIMIHQQTLLGKLLTAIEALNNPVQRKKRKHYDGKP
jgi:hypothetical protein